jgi:hypothetical protein
VINLLPHTTETLIVVHDWDVVIERLSDVTVSQVTERISAKTLAGWVKDDRFQLMIRQRRPNSFMPVVEGRIDPISNGCLIFLHYRLMPMTRMYLILWTIIAFLSGVFLSLYYGNFLLLLAAVAIIGLIHSIAWANFKIHHKPLHDVIFKILS